MPRLEFALQEDGRTREKWTPALKGPKRSTGERVDSSPRSRQKRRRDEQRQQDAELQFHFRRQAAASRAHFSLSARRGWWGAVEREPQEVRRAGNRWQNHLGGFLDPVGVVWCAVVAPSARLHFFLNPGTCASGVGGRNISQVEGARLHSARPLWCVVHRHRARDSDSCPGR